jgi:hypothetical protein
MARKSEADVLYKELAFDRDDPSTNPAALGPKYTAHAAAHYRTQQTNRIL